MKLTTIGIILGSVMWAIGGMLQTNKDLSFYLGVFGLIFVFGSLYLKARKEDN